MLTLSQLTPALKSALRNSFVHERTGARLLGPSVGATVRRKLRDLGLLETNVHGQQALTPEGTALAHAAMYAKGQADNKLPLHTIRYWATECYRHFAYRGVSKVLRNKTVQGAVIECRAVVVQGSNGPEVHINVDYTVTTPALDVHKYSTSIKAARSWLY